MTSYKPVNIEPPKSETEEPAVNGHDPEQEQKGHKKPKLNKRQVLEDALGYYYEFRRNDLTKIPEYRETDKEDAPWIRMTDDDLYSIERRLQLEGYTYASDSLITKIIKSDYAPRFHPIRDYFNDLPKWDGEDHIKKLADTAKTTVKKELWHKYLKKWIVGAVANVLIENFCANPSLPDPGG
jgi:predicted P-loop ATPase